MTFPPGPIVETLEFLKSVSLILVHRFVAYKKFGEAVLEAGCIRDFNHNSLDIRPDNIDIGTYRGIYEAMIKNIS